MTEAFAWADDSFESVPGENMDVQSWHSNQGSEPMPSQCDPDKAGARERFASPPRSSRSAWRPLQEDNDVVEDVHDYDDPKHHHNADHHGFSSPHKTLINHKKQGYNPPSASPAVNGYGGGLTNGKAGKFIDTQDEPADESEDLTPYPADRPLINDDYTRNPDKPITAYPENNRQALKTALESLHDKVKQLDIERSEAEAKVNNLTSETSRYRDLVGSRNNNYLSFAPERTRTPDIDDTSRFSEKNPNSTDIGRKLDAAEERYRLLDKQLEHMRQLVTKAETDRSATMQRAAMVDSQRALRDEEDAQHQLGKIGMLERDQLKLSAVQTLSENKIRELEQQLKEERHYRKFMQEKAAELENREETNRIIQEASRRPVCKKTKKKKRVQSSKYAHECRKVRKEPENMGIRPGREPPGHYKLNMAEIPFVTGKSTTPSHSLTANFQEVLHMMKTHNPQLCGSPRNHMRNGFKYFSPSPTRGKQRSLSASDDPDLIGLLVTLQDEFGQMSSEHQELCRQVQEATDDGVREDLERELDHVVSRMESKGEQIARLQSHYQMSKKKPKVTKQKMKMHPMNTDVEVTTTVKTKSKPGSVLTPEETSPTGQSGRAQASLNLYKGLKKIQSTLRKNDITWDCN